MIYICGASGVLVEGARGPSAPPPPPTPALSPRRSFRVDSDTARPRARSPRSSASPRRPVPLEGVLLPRPRRRLPRPLRLEPSAAGGGRGEGVQGRLQGLAPPPPPPPRGRLSCGRRCRSRGGAGESEGRGAGCGRVLMRARDRIAVSENARASVGELRARRGCVGGCFGGQASARFAIVNARARTLRGKKRDGRGQNKISSSFKHISINDFESSIIFLRQLG